MPEVRVLTPNEEVRFLKACNRNVEQEIREALHERIEWMRFHEAQSRLQKVRFRPSRPPEELILEDRGPLH